MKNFPSFSRNIMNSNSFLFYCHRVLYHRFRSGPEHRFSPLLRHQFLIYAWRFMKSIMKSRTTSTLSIVCGLYMVTRMASEDTPSGCDFTSSQPFSTSVSCRNFATRSALAPSLPESTGLTYEAQPVHQPGTRRRWRMAQALANAGIIRQRHRPRAVCHPIQPQTDTATGRAHPSPMVKTTCIRERNRS